jgi:hypothetical protein
MLVATPAWAVTDEEIHNSCQAHLNITIGASGRILAKPGYQAGWEKCEQFEQAYQAALSAKAAIAKKQGDAEAVARDAEAKAALPK